MHTISEAEYVYYMELRANAERQMRIFIESALLVSYVYGSRSVIKSILWVSADEMETVPPSTFYTFNLADGNYGGDIRRICESMGDNVSITLALSSPDPTTSLMMRRVAETTQSK